MIGSPAQFNKNETEEEVRVTEESTFAFATNVGREAKEMIKGLSVLKEQDTNSPQKRLKRDPMANSGKKSARRTKSHSRITNRKPDYSHIQSKVKAGMKRKKPDEPEQKDSTSKSTSKSRNVPIYNKSTIAYETRLKLNAEARARKKQTPVKSRFSTLGSLYYDGNKDSPNPLDYFDAPSSLSKTGGYWSRTSRPAPKVATEVAPLEEIGLAHAPIVAKGPQSFPKDKRPELFKPKETEETQPEDEAAKKKRKKKRKKRKRENRRLSMQFAEGISNGLSSSNAKVLESNTLITTADELIGYQMTRALKILSTHLNNEKGQKIIKCIAMEATGKKSKEITDEDLTAATAELKSMLGKAVKEHCVNWWATNVHDDKPLAVKKLEDAEDATIEEAN